MRGEGDGSGKPGVKAAAGDREPGGGASCASWKMRDELGRCGAVWEGSLVSGCAGAGLPLGHPIGFS